MTDTKKDEIEVTPEMIEEGFKVFVRSGLVDEALEADKLWLVEIYQAMASYASLKAK